MDDRHQTQEKTTTEGGGKNISVEGCPAGVLQGEFRGLNTRFKGGGGVLGSVGVVMSQECRVQLVRKEKISK